MKFRNILLLLLPAVAFANPSADSDAITHARLRSERYFIKHSEEFGKKFDLDFVTGGVTLFEKVPNVYWTVAYMSRKPMKEEEAADLACRLFAHVIEEASKFKDNIIAINKDLNATTLDTKKAALRITYWDENYDRMYPPYVAQVAIWDDKVHIFKADPKTEKLLPPTDYLPGCAK